MYIYIEVIKIIYLKKYYRKVLVILIFLGILLFIFLFSINRKNIDLETNEEDLNIENTILDEVKTETHKFNIKGAVVNPGVYSFSEGDRVIDAIEKSGGLLENADTSVINLSKNLFDEMVIIIYTYDEVNAMKNSNIIIQYVEKECNCPDIKNDACLSNDDTNYSDNNIDKNNESITKKVSINKASIEELTTLSGIGETKAKAIISYREENGNFSRIEDIMNVSGIGENIFAKIKDYITI